MSDDHMKAGITLTGLQLVRGYGRGTPTTQAMVDATRELIDGGGTGDWVLIPDRDARAYTFEGPPELVRPVVNAFMQFIHEAESD